MPVSEKRPLGLEPMRMRPTTDLAWGPIKTELDTSELVVYTDLRLRLESLTPPQDPHELLLVPMADQYFTVEPWAAAEGIPRGFTALALVAPSTPGVPARAAFDPSEDDEADTSIGEAYRWAPKRANTTTRTWTVKRKHRVRKKRDKNHGIRKKTYTEQVVTSITSMPAGANLTATGVKPFYRARARYWRGKRAEAPAVKFSTARDDADELALPDTFTDGDTSLTVLMALVLHEGRTQTSVLQMLRTDTGAVDFGLVFTRQEALRFFDSKLASNNPKQKWRATLPANADVRRGAQLRIVGLGLDRVGAKVQVRMGTLDASYRSNTFFITPTAGTGITKSGTRLCVGGDVGDFAEGEKGGSIDLFDMRAWTTPLDEETFERKIHDLGALWGVTA